jgi:tetratricopeptide (TPR) repeat protein
LGVVYSALGEYDRALIEYRDAFRLYPESALIYANIALTLIALNRFDEARATANEAKAKNHNSPGLRLSFSALPSFRTI